METEAIPARASRQAAVLPPDKLATVKVAIIGVGAIGRQVALQLAAMGQKHITMYDFDVVEDVNLGPQGYYESDIGRSKVEATKEVMLKNNAEGLFTIEERRIGMDDEVGDVIFCCVDSITTRKNIWERYNDKVGLFIDGRMSAEVMRLVCAYDDETREYYPETLFEESEAFQGPCTARSTIFTANIAAGGMISQYSKWLRGMVFHKDVLMNLLAWECTAKL